MRARYRSSKQVFARLSIEFGFQEDSQKTFPRSCLYLFVKDYDGFLYVSMQDNQIISNKAFGYIVTFSYCRAGEAAEKETLRSLAASRIVYRSKAVLPCYTTFLVTKCHLYLDESSPSSTFLSSPLLCSFDICLVYPQISKSTKYSQRLS